MEKVRGFLIEFFFLLGVPIEEFFDPKSGGPPNFGDSPTRSSGLRIQIIVERKSPNLDAIRTLDLTMTCKLAAIIIFENRHGPFIKHPFDQQFVISHSFEVDKGRRGGRFENLGGGEDPLCVGYENREVIRGQWPEVS